MIATKIEWLAELETKVHEAAERLTALREENRALTEKVEELEAKLTVATAATADGSGEESTLWQEEREEIRRRVGALTEVLEGLVEG